MLSIRRPCWSNDVTCVRNKAFSLLRIYSVLTDVIQAPDERRDIGWLLCALRCRIDRGCLLLRKAKRHIDPHALLHRILRRRRPSAVHGYLMYALGIHENISLPLAEHL